MRLNLHHTPLSLLALALLPACSSLIPSPDSMTIVSIRDDSVLEEVTSAKMTPAEASSNEGIAEGFEGIHRWHIGMLSSELNMSDLSLIAQDFGRDPKGFSSSATQRIRLLPRDEETFLAEPAEFDVPISSGVDVQNLTDGVYTIELKDAAQAHVRQEDDQSCWAACVETYGKVVFNVESDHIAIADKFNLFSGEGNRKGDLFRIILGLEELQERGSKWSQSFIGTAGVTLALAPSTDEIVSSLVAGRPWIVGLPPQGSEPGHAVLLIGGEFARYKGDNFMKSTSWRARSLVIMDPAYADGRVELTDEEMLAGFDFYIDHIQAEKLIKNLHDVHTEAAESLEDAGFDLLSYLGSTVSR